MTRGERIAADRMWDAAWELELPGARRRALCSVLRQQKRPTLRDLLIQLGEGRCDLADTPTAGDVRLGDLVHRDGKGQLVIHLVRQLGLGLEDPLRDAERLQLRELDRPLVELLD